VRVVRILFATPAYWPAVSFGGPIPVARTLCEGLAARGHEVHVVTTSIVDLRGGRTLRSRSARVGGVTVHRLATPLRYRWMGITPSLPLALERLPRPDVAHVFGFRDVVTTVTAAWCLARRVPYVFEPLGMFQPRVRKLRLKRSFDATVGRHVLRGASAFAAVSEREAGALVAGGARPELVTVRGNAFPEPASGTPRGALRGPLGLDGEPLVLYVGRLASGKGIELLLSALRGLPEAHLALVGPDDGHGTGALVADAAGDPATAGRIHVLGSVEDPLPLYADADVFVLPSEGESFGLVAAEAAAAGTPVVVTDRCGIAEFLGEGEALVVPADAGSLRDALRRVLDEPELRARLAAGGRAAAARNSADAVVERQERILLDAIARRG
jgi:glycosyltransferase involved in cell wall biosynthesis